MLAASTVVAPPASLLLLPELQRDVERFGAGAHDRPGTIAQLLLWLTGTLASPLLLRGN